VMYGSTVCACSLASTGFASNAKGSMLAIQYFEGRLPGAWLLRMLKVPGFMLKQ